MIDDAIAAATHAATGAATAASTDDAPRGVAGTSPPAAGGPAELPAALLVHGARVLAGAIRSSCVATGDGDARWATAERDDGDNLYGGALGIAVFLAAYARVDGSAWARDLALRAAAPTRRAAEACGAAAVAAGGLVGRGAQIYGLVTLGRLLDEPALLAEAHRLATRLEPGWIGADRRFDVVHGSAGLILALLSLGPAVAERGPGGTAPLAHVRTASAHLVAMQRPPGAPWAGAVLGGGDALPQSGFAHGATGASVALARAGQVLGDDALFAAAARALAFERDHLAFAPGRWRAAPGDPRTPIGWCRGAPGAALGRRAVLDAGQGQLDSTDASAAQREIAEALVYLSGVPPMPLDHLCCGGMAVVDALIALSRAEGVAVSPVDRRALGAAAHARAGWILRAARARGRFVPGTDEPGDPSLFQGLAGVGYGLLRLADPALPCIPTMT